MSPWLLMFMLYTRSKGAIDGFYFTILDLVQSKGRTRVIHSTQLNICRGWRNAFHRLNSLDRLHDMKASVMGR